MSLRLLTSQLSISLKTKGASDLTVGHPRWKESQCPPSGWNKADKTCGCSSSWKAGDCAAGRVSQLPGGALAERADLPGHPWPLGQARACVSPVWRRPGKTMEAAAADPFEPVLHVLLAARAQHLVLPQ